MSEPTVFVFIGSAGSGKSSAARLTARMLGAAYLDKDTLVSPLTELLLSERGEDPLQRESSAYYRQIVFPAEYRALLRTAADNLALGLSVVLDAPFFAVLGDPDYLERARAEACWPLCRVVVVTVGASEATVRRRLEARAYPRDAWKLAHWAEFWAMMRDLRCTWSGVEFRHLDNDGEPFEAARLGALLGLASGPAT